MLFTEYLIKRQRIDRISWKFRYWFNLKSSVEYDIKKIDVILVQCPFKYFAVDKIASFCHIESCAKKQYKQVFNKKCKSTSSFLHVQPIFIVFISAC